MSAEGHATFEHSQFLEARDNEGNTAFVHACISGSGECITELRKAGCNKDATNSDGKTGPELAGHCGHDPNGPRCDEDTSAQNNIVQVVMARLEKNETAANAFDQSKALAAQKRWVQPKDLAQEAWTLDKETNEQGQDTHINPEYQSWYDHCVLELAKHRQMVEKAEEAEAQLMAMLDGEQAASQTRTNKLKVRRFNNPTNDCAVIV